MFSRPEKGAKHGRIKVAKTRCFFLDAGENAFLGQMFGQFMLSSVGCTKRRQNIRSTRDTSSDHFVVLDGSGLKPGTFGRRKEFERIVHSALGCGQLELRRPCGWEFELESLVSPVRTRDLS